MKQLAIIAEHENEIEGRLRDCVERLESIGVWVYATHRGRDYAIMWVDEHLHGRDAQRLRDSGFNVAFLTHNRSPQIRTPTLQGTVSNQNDRQEVRAETRLQHRHPAIQHGSDPAFGRSQRARGDRQDGTSDPKAGSAQGSLFNPPLYSPRNLISGANRFVSRPRPHPNIFVRQPLGRHGSR
jgi:hypothetical protein